MNLMRYVSSPRRRGSQLNTLDSRLRGNDRPLIFLLILTFSLLTSLTLFASDWNEFQKSGDKNVKWNEYIKEGFNSYEAGNLGPAEMFLQRAIARGCDDGLVYAKIGTYYELQSNYTKALEYFKKAAAKLPKQYPNHQYTKNINEMIGRTLYMLGKKEDAKQYLEKSLDHGENFTALYLLGQMSAEKKDNPNIIKYFSRALKAEHPQGTPQNADILMMLEIGKAYYETGKEASSMEIWDAVLSVDPKNPIANSYRDAIQKKKYKEEEKKVMEKIVQ